MGNPIVTKLEIVQDLDRETAVANLRKELEAESAKNPETILKKYIVVVSTGDFIGMISDKSKEILGADSNIVIDSPLMNVSLEDIPSKFLKDYQVAVKKDSPLTEEEVTKIAQDKANEILKQKDNKTIPVVRVMNIKENKDTQVVVPDTFGANFFDTEAEQVKSKTLTRDLTEDDIQTAVKRTLITLKNRGIEVEDVEVVVNEVEASLKKAASLIKIAEDTEKKIVETLKENGVDETEAKMTAERISHTIKEKGNIVGIDSILDKELETVIKDQETKTKLVTELSKTVTGIASVHTQPVGDKPTKTDARNRDEIMGNQANTKDLTPEQTKAVADRIAAEIKDGITKLGYELDPKTVTAVVNYVTNAIITHKSDSEINNNVYDILVKDPNIEDADAEELTMSVATIVDQRKVAQYETAVYQISDELKQMIFHMVNEEKLAMDIYNYAKTLYPEEKVFNIGEFAERKHMDTAKAIAEKYGFNEEDFDKLPEGKFNDEGVQALYDQLKKEVETSKIDALKVGVKVEVVDSDDIDELIELAKKEQATDLINIYSNLVNASHQHYWSFDKALKDNGVEEGAASVGEEFTKTEEEYPRNFSKGNNTSKTGTQNEECEQPEQQDGVAQEKQTTSNSDNAQATEAQAQNTDNAQATEAQAQAKQANKPEDVETKQAQEKQAQTNTTSTEAATTTK